MRYLPPPVRRGLVRFEEYGRGFFTGGTLFEEMGFYYVGPIDGHNFNHLLPILKNVKSNNDGPTLIHVVTKRVRAMRLRRHQKINFMEYQSLI